jgi:hypothetical protein
VDRLVADPEAFKIIYGALRENLIFTIQNADLKQAQEINSESRTFTSLYRKQNGILLLNGTNEFTRLSVDLLRERTRWILCVKQNPLSMGLSGTFLVNLEGKQEKELTWASGSNFMP